MEDLIAKYGDTEIREKFRKFKDSVYEFSDTDGEFKIGDIVSFFGGHDGDINFKSEILGFDDEGRAFMLWDCYWFAIRPAERQFKKITL